MPSDLSNQLSLFFNSLKQYNSSILSKLYFITLWTFIPLGTKSCIILSNFSKSKSILPNSTQSIPQPISTPTMLGITLSPKLPVKPITHPAPA